MHKKLFVFVFCFLASHFSIGQNYSSSNSRAIKAFETAIRCFNQNYYDKALEYLDDALKNDPSFIEAYLLKGDLFDRQKKYDQSIDAYSSSIKINPDFFPNTYYTLGKLEFRTEKYDSSKAHFEKFLS